MAQPPNDASAGNMTFYNEKFAQNKRKYILQCLAAAIVVLFVLLSVTSITSGFIIASIASSAFTIFTRPNSPLASTTSIFFGYIVGSLSGLICFILLVYCHDLTPIYLMYDRAFFGALSVGLSMFLMLVFKVAHPPACGVSLALVLNPWEPQVLLITVGAVFILTGSRYLLRHYLIDLI